MNIGDAAIEFEIKELDVNITSPTKETEITILEEV